MDIGFFKRILDLKKKKCFFQFNGFFKMYLYFLFLVSDLGSVKFVHLDPAFVLVFVVYHTLNLHRVPN